MQTVVLLCSLPRRTCYALGIIRSNILVLSQTHLNLYNNQYTLIPCKQIQH